MSGRERQLWTEFVRKREERKDEKQARKRRAKKPQPTPAGVMTKLGLTLNEAKTSVRNARQECFDFLGYGVLQRHMERSSV
jgi:hypothetical protein